MAATSVSAPIEVGLGAHAVVVNEDGTRAYVTNTADDLLYIVCHDRLTSLRHPDMPCVTS